MLTRADGARLSEQPPSGTLELVARLCGVLRDEGIRYCHWKSTIALDRSARGENDLDLLIGATDAQRFAEILRRLGFKEAIASRPFPGVIHAYGLDEATGRLVHVHAQYALVIGDDMTKNIRLPIEDAFLASAVHGPLFATPSTEFEFVLLVIRMVLKRATWDAVAVSHGNLTRSERREFDDLSTRADPDAAWRIVDEHLRTIDRELWDRCILTVRGDAPMAFRVRTAHDLQRALRSCSRRGNGADTMLRLSRRAKAVALRSVLGRPPERKQLDTGGTLIAIVGGDGSGKSTVVRGLRRSFGDAIRTVDIHMGKPPRSVAARLIRAGLAPLRGRGYASLAWDVLAARDRYRAYRKARRLASNGTIVICDRFPLADMTAMDGPRARTVARTAPHLARALARREARYYRSILPPDLVVVLRVHPDVAVVRKTEEDASYVHERAEAIWRHEWSDPNVIVIDASKGPDEVLAEVRSSVWERI